MAPYKRGIEPQPDHEISHDNIVELNILHDDDDDDEDIELENETNGEEEHEEEEDADNANKTYEMDSDDDEEDDNCNDAEAKERKKQKVVNAYVKMIIDVLMPFRTWDNTIFKSLMEMFSRNSVDMDAVKSKIVKKYTTMQDILKPLMKTLMKQQPYSLGVEIYESQVQYMLNLDIYINYVSENPPYEIHSILYASSHIWLEDMRKLADWQEKFVDFDLTNCSAIILSGHLKQALKGFTALFSQQYKIPIIPCLEHLVNRCLRSIFKVRVIKKAIGQLFYIIDQNKEFNPDSLIDCYSNSCWSQLNYFQLYFEKYSHLLLDNCERVPKVDKEFMQDMKYFVDYLFPLKIVLESAVEEPLPSFCSAAKPMLERVFNLLENKKPEFANNKYVQAAYDKFKKNLPSPILSDTFIMEATFFDPRFDFDLKNLKHIKKNIKEKFQKLIATIDDDDDDNNNKNDKEAAPTSSTEKKGLQKFFDRINHISNDSNTAGAAASSSKKSNFEMEFKKYIHEKKLNLEQCPITWWDMHKNQYQILSKIAGHYLTVPLSVNRLFKCEPNSRIDVQNKREVLGGKDASYYDPEPEPPHEIDGYLWYVRYNQKIFKKITKPTKKKSNDDE